MTGAYGRLGENEAQTKVRYGEPAADLVGEKEKTERDLAEGVARRGAAEIMQGEFGSAGVAANSIAQIGSLPDEIREQTPVLQRNGLRAWLL